MYRRNCKETLVTKQLFNNIKISSLINGMLDCLPKEQQDCTRMFYIEEKNQDQIVKELGIPLRTVESRLSKGKERIGEMVLEYQKKGTESYDLSPILLFWWYSKNCFEEEKEYQNVLLGKMLDMVEYEGFASGKGNVLAVRKNGLWSLIDYEGNVILEPTYQTIFSYPNEKGYAIFDNGDEFHIVGGDGKIHVFRGNIANIAIGEDDIVTYITEYSHAAARQCVVYEDLDGEVLYKTKYKCRGENILYHNASHYITAFHEGKAYLPETFEEGAAIVELSTNGSLSHLHIQEDTESAHFSAFMPIGSCSDGYVAGQFLPGSGIALLDTECMKRSECIESVSEELFPEKSLALQISSFGMNSYDANGECYNYKNYGCLWVAFADRTSKAVLFDYFSVGENGRLEESIATYDRILFDDFKYLAVKNGEEWFYIDYQGNIVSKTYKAATSFNDEGYALVLEEDGNAYVIDYTFQVLENAGPAVSVETCGEMFAIDYRYLFYYGEKYL